jgi:hypothetical protein
MPTLNETHTESVNIFQLFPFAFRLRHTTYRECAKTLIRFEWKQCRHLSSRQVKCLLACHSLWTLLQSVKTFHYHKWHKKKSACSENFSSEVFRDVFTLEHLLFGDMFLPWIKPHAFSSRKCSIKKFATNFIREWHSFECGVCGRRTEWT